MTKISDASYPVLYCRTVEPDAREVNWAINHRGQKVPVARYYLVQEAGSNPRVSDMFGNDWGISVVFLSEQDLTRQGYSQKELLPGDCN